MRALLAPSLAAGADPASPLCVVPAGARARVALTGLTVAEYFRDEEGQDVLLFVDNIFRFTQVGPGWGRGAALHVPSGRGATWHVCWVPPCARACQLK